MRLVLHSNGDILCQRPCYVKLGEGDMQPKSMAHVMAAVRAANPAFNNAAGLCSAWDGERVLDPNDLQDNERYVAVGDDFFMLKRVRVSQRVPVIAVRESVTAAAMSDYRSRSRHRTPSADRAADQSQQASSSAFGLPPRAPPASASVNARQAPAASRRPPLQSHRDPEHSADIAEQQQQQQQEPLSRDEHRQAGADAPALRKRTAPLLPPSADEDTSNSPPHLRPAQTESKKQQQRTASSSVDATQQADLAPPVAAAAPPATVAAVAAVDAGTDAKTPVEAEQHQQRQQQPSSAEQSRRSVSRDAETQWHAQSAPAAAEAARAESGALVASPEPRQQEEQPPAKQEEAEHDQKQPATDPPAAASQSPTAAAAAATALANKLNKLSRERKNDSDSDSSSSSSTSSSSGSSDAAQPVEEVAAAPPTMGEAPAEDTAATVADDDDDVVAAAPPPLAVSVCTAETQTDPVRIDVAPPAGEDEEEDEDDFFRETDASTPSAATGAAASPSPRGRRSTFAPALEAREISSKDEKMELYEFVDKVKARGAAQASSSPATPHSSSAAPSRALSTARSGSSAAALAAARQFEEAWSNLLELQDLSSVARREVLFADAIVERVCPGASAAPPRSDDDEQVGAGDSSAAELRAQRLVFQSRVIVGPERSGRSTALQLFVRRVVQPAMVEAVAESAAVLHRNNAAAGGRPAQQQHQNLHAAIKWWCVPLSFNQLHSVMHSSFDGGSRDAVSWQQLSQCAVHWVTSLFESVAVHRGSSHAYGLHSLSSFFASAFAASASTAAAPSVPAIPAPARAIVAPHAMPALSLLWSNLQRLAARTALALLPQQQQQQSTSAKVRLDATLSLFHALFQMPLLLREALAFERVLLIVDDVDADLVPSANAGAAGSTATPVMQLLAEIVKGNPRMSLVCTARESSVFPAAAPGTQLLDVCERCTLKGVATDAALFRELGLPPVLCVEEKALGNSKRRAAFQHRFLSRELFAGYPGFATRFFAEIKHLSGAVLLMRRNLLADERQQLVALPTEEQEQEQEEQPYALVITDFAEMVKFFVALAERANA